MGWSQSRGIMNITNVEYTVRELMKVPGIAPAQPDEGLYNWMCNLVRQEGQPERVSTMSRRCMTRFLDSLDQDTVPVAPLPPPGRRLPPRHLQDRQPGAAQCQAAPQVLGGRVQLGGTHVL